VRVWDVREKIQVCEFSGHKFSIECVCFSPNGNYIVSIGSIHDKSINVWDVKNRFNTASNKISSRVRGLSFSHCGSYFVTVGMRHVKFWKMNVSKILQTVPIIGRAAILGDHRNSNFCDVACSESVDSTFALTSNGLLCEFDSQRQLSRVVDIKTERGYCLFADKYHVYTGCSNGTILIYSQKTLMPIARLPLPHHLGVDVTKGKDTQYLIDNMMNSHEIFKYPDCIALCYDQFSGVLTSIYNDHSLYVWSIIDLQQVKKIESHLFHSSSCWSLDLFNHNESPSSCLPNNSFITCSTDNTLRVWTLPSEY
jgi:mitogen-activated protein kinase binding protein 1